MKIKVDEVERYPAAYVWLPGDEGYEAAAASGFDLAPDQVEDLRRARDAWRHWETLLLAMLDPEGR